MSISSVDLPGRTAPRIVFLFAGQGSQYFQMGREFYAQKPVFRDWMNFCSRRLEPILGLSLVELLYKPGADPFAAFDETRLTHPAIFCINYCVTQTLVDEGIRPSVLLGYSLGELVAWAVAGILRLEDALALVCAMGTKIERDTPPAAMLAVLGSPGLMEEHPRGLESLTVACLNYAQNFVLVGSPGRIADAHQELRSRDVPCQPLPITRGFHSPFLDPIERELTAMVARVSLRLPEIPVASCMLAGNLEARDISPRHCWDVVRAPVRFLETIQYLEAQSPSVYVDVGPSGTLASFVRMIVGRDGASKAYPILTPFGQDLNNLGRLKSALEKVAATPNLMRQ